MRGKIIWFGSSVLWVALQTEIGVADFRDDLLALPWEFGDCGVRLGGSTQDRFSLFRVPDQHVRLWWLPPGVKSWLGEE